MLSSWAKTRQNSWHVSENDGCDCFVDAAPRGAPVAVKRPSVLAMLAVVAAIGACGRNDPASSESESNVTLLGTVWQWQAFEDSADGAESHDVAVADPEDFTLRLDAGNAAIRADCNSVSWSYDLDGSSLSFNTTGPTTMAYCGDESLDRRYLELLGNTATYVLVDETLYLNLRMDAGNMVFSAAD